MNIVVAKDAEDLADRACAEFVRIVRDSVDERGSFAVALSGGSTPILLYRRLCDANLDWSSISFYFSDERNVSPEEDASNFRTANKELFRPLRVREDRIFRWRTELETPEDVAADYARHLERVPRFDLILLGMGTDGHTASLFPGTKALHESDERAAANWVPQLGSWRFTLTFPTLNDARNVMFLVSGADKGETLKAVLEGESRPEDLPAQRVRPTEGSLTWLIDQAAGSHLSSSNI